MTSATMRAIPLASLFSAVLIAGFCLADADAKGASAPASDPYAWLEEVTGDKALQWVSQQNAKTAAGLASTPEFKQLEPHIREVMDSEAKIPEVEKIGGYYYNFWKDKQHRRGIWRRTTLEEYRKRLPQWETVLDIDALNLEEGTDWAWREASCLRPEYARCLIVLSRSGADADVTREFDLKTKQWVKDGFFRPLAKGHLSWKDKDTVYVSTDFGPGSTTSSGYPRIVKQWKRGTALSSATTIFEGKHEDVSVEVQHKDDPGFERDLILRKISTQSDELFLRTHDGKLVKIDAPDSAFKRVKREWLTLALREPWTIAGKTYAADSLLAIRFDDFMAGKREFDVLFQPTETTSLTQTVWTRSHLVLNVLDNVKTKLIVLTPGADGWKRTPFVGAPALGVATVSDVDSSDSDAVWLNVSDMLTPPTLALAEIGRPPQPLKSLPAMFDASGLVAEQHFVSSKDGTQIPYFLVRRKDLNFDARAPTIIYGYGGFGVSLTPAYSGTIGRAWLEKGGVFVLANIRGGGEYGVRWRLAAQKQKRHKAYEDMAAIAQDLIARRVTSPSHLGVYGNSNGGLMAGNMLTQYTDLFGAVVIESPLLDMKRYSHLLAGASWMGEYGNPDTADWSFIQTFSPYQLFDPKKNYPPVLIQTSTRDDRVHPGHARKMAAKMLDAGKDVTYYESTDGGHADLGDTVEAAHRATMTFAFFWRQLGGDRAEVNAK